MKPPGSELGCLGRSFYTDKHWRKEERLASEMGAKQSLAKANQFDDSMGPQPVCSGWLETKKKQEPVQKHEQLATSEWEDRAPQPGQFIQRASSHERDNARNKLFLPPSQKQKNTKVSAVIQPEAIDTWPKKPWKHQPKLGALGGGWIKKELRFSRLHSGRPAKQAQC